MSDEIASILVRAPRNAPSLAQIMGVQLDANRCPFFDVAMAVGDGEATFDFDSYPVDLAFLFDTEAGLISGRVFYAADLFDRSTIDRAVAHLRTAAKQMSVQPTLRVADIDVLEADERRRVLEDFQGRSVPFPLDRTLHGLFEDQVGRTPHAVAAVHGATRLSYSELNSRANRLAQTLLARGLGKGEFVGILLNRDCDFVAAMLAVFKAGGAYVPLDPTYPRDRVLYMVDDSQAAFIISNSSLVQEFSDVVASVERLKVVLCVDGAETRLAPLGSQVTAVGREEIASMPDREPELPLVGSDRAYMIYTSGSTGRPKGAICHHDGALNHLYGELSGLEIHSAFTFLQTAATSSDISVWQFMAPLLFGGATVIADYEVVVDPERLFAMIRDHRVSVAELVPIVLRGLVDHIAELPETKRSLPSLRYMMATGEALAAEVVDRWLAFYPEIPVANTYGPTETSDDVTLRVVQHPLAEQHAVVPIGRPLPNVFVFVLDRELRPVPIGVPGEICIAGIGVGEGYWRQPEKTLAAFVPCPFPHVWKGPMYRSGDLGRWLPDGSVEFLGRIDQQVKIRGFRVEPGEIEELLTHHPAIQDAVVVAVRDSVGNNRLAGYYVPRKDHSVDSAELRKFLHGALADHMIPATLVRLTALPLTPLGKVDRKALARIEQQLETTRSENYVSPRSQSERALAAAWCSVLHREQIGIYDNFFEIGGDSILAIHVIAELRRIGLRIAPKDLFVNPTIAELAARIDTTGQAPEKAGIASQSPALVVEAPQWNLDRLLPQLTSTFPDLEDVYPLAPTQRGIYFQSILPSRTSGGYVEQIGFELHGTLDQDAFAKAWQQTANVTDVFRTMVVRRGVPQPMQVVVHSAPLVPHVEDLRRLSEADRTSWVESLLVEDRKKGFDLGQPPLTRVTLSRLANNHWHVLWTYHHIILDGWSEPLVLGDVFAAYNALMGGSEGNHARQPRYRDFVAWTEAQDMSPARDFWRQQLGGFVSPVKIKDDSPAVQPPASAELSHGWDDIVLSHTETHRLNDLARRNKVTLSTIVHGAWSVLLHRHTGSTDVVFGSVASGRQCGFPDVESIRGVVVVTQPIRTRLMGDVPFSSWLRLLQLQMAEVREFEQTPLALIQQWCDVPADKRPLFDTLVVMANYLGSDLSGLRPSGLKLSNVSYFTQPIYALTLFIVSGEQTTIRLVYDKRRYAGETARRLLDEYKQLLIGFAENPEQRLPIRPAVAH
jgi:amino acid adenylation domain-containing protein